MNKSAPILAQQLTRIKNLGGVYQILDHNQSSACDRPPNVPNISPIFSAIAQASIGYRMGVNMQYFMEHNTHV